MKTIDEIKIGDIVSVNFNNSQVTLCKSATVISKPCQPGDWWIFQDDNTSLLYYVSEGCTVSKHINEGFYK